MCQTIKQHQRLVKGNKAMAKNMAISKTDAEQRTQRRISRVFWCGQAVIYAGIFIAILAYAGVL